MKDCIQRTFIAALGIPRFLFHAENWFLFVSDRPNTSAITTQSQRNKQRNDANAMYRCAFGMLRAAATRLGIGSPSRTKYSIHPWYAIRR
jgi:hypothetical protein